MPLFSVIIPSYNRRQLLQEALASVWQQTCTDFEVIVIDDGSSDGTWDYLQSLGSSIIALRQDNRGPGAARNKGVEAAGGRYIAFLDSDDLWFPWTLEVFRKAFASSAEVSLVAGSQLVGELFDDIADKQQFVNYSCLFAAVGAMLPLGGTPSVAIEKRIFHEAGGFSSDNLNSEDIHLWLRLGMAPGFVRIESPPLFMYRMHDANITFNVARNICGLGMLMAKERAGDYPGGKQYRRVRLRVITAMFRSASFQLLACGDEAAAWRLYVQSLQWQLEQRRCRYVLGFPIMAMFARFVRCVRGSHG